MRHRFLNMKNFLLFSCFFTGVLAACMGPTAVPRAESITCTTAYRPSTGHSITREESITLADENGEQTVAFSDLEFHASYWSGEMDNERALRVWVTRAGETAELLAQLYQLPGDSGPLNQFIGGHGFTGLNYVYHPESGAELQYFCTAGN